MEMKHDMRAILGEDFFKEEVRCDYKISAAQKMVWAMQLDLYLVFKEICNKYNLRHFFFYGSMLGAVRHNGFIPWDDDVDVAMPRKDFNTFLRVAPKELKEPYALQSPYTYPNCFMSNITMRNSMGTFTAKAFKHLDYNKGIPLDIFPLDYCNLDTILEDRLKIHDHIMRCSSWMKLQNPHLSGEQLEKSLKYKTDNPLHDWEEIHRIISNPSYENSEYMTMGVIVINLMHPPIFKSKWFEKAVPHKFESLEVDIPIGWDEFLTERYGNYMEFPPVPKRGAINDAIIVDPYTPYKEYDFDKL